MTRGGSHGHAARRPVTSGVEIVRSSLWTTGVTEGQSASRIGQHAPQGGEGGVITRVDGVNAREV
eukprot:4610239-Prymnesium_polylepis.2